MIAEKSKTPRVQPHAPCKLPGGALFGNGGGEGLDSLAGSCDTSLSATEMLSDSEEERVSSTANSYDYGESRALCPAEAGAGHQGWVGVGWVFPPSKGREDGGRGGFPGG